MAQPPSSLGIAPPFRGLSRTASARLREVSEFLAAPDAGRLTEEQRALTLGIARRLVVDVADRFNPALDGAALWNDWIRNGLPGADRLAEPCFARAEEHRWRRQSSAEQVEPESGDISEAAALVANAEVDTGDATDMAIDRAHLALKIADRRRFDALGNPCLAIADLESGVFQALMLDVAAWSLVRPAVDTALAGELGETVRAALSAQSQETGIDAAAARYAKAAETDGIVGASITRAITRHDWPIVIALAATAHGLRYDQMAILMLSGNAARIAMLLQPLGVDPNALATLESSLETLPDRAVSDGDTQPDADDLVDLLRARAAILPHRDGKNS